MSVYCSTILSRSSAGIISYISRLKHRYPKHSLAFALSSNTDSNNLSSLVTCLTTFSERTVGCLSSPLAHEPRDVISCSIALFDTTLAVPFRSTIPGRETPQVGRWHAFRKKDDDSQDELRQPEFDGLANLWQLSKPVDPPTELRDLA